MAKKAKPEWPANKPVMTAIDKIQPYPNNPRTHPPAQIAMLAAIMKRRGVDQPIVVDEDFVILKGHGRRLAALQAGFEEYPVVMHRGLSDADKAAMRIEDNQVALLAGWDTKLMTSEIGSLKLAGYDVKLLGFSEVQLRNWDDKAPKGNNPEIVPDAPKKPIVRKGDLWHLGEHRLICGDSTDPETWRRLFGTARASLIFTDPPYGVSYKAETFGVIEGDKKRRDELYQMLQRALQHMVARAVDNAAFYIWHASSTREDFADAIKAVGLTERQYLLWVKPAFVFGRADYQWAHEPCFYAAKADHKPAFYGERAESTVWHAQVSNTKDAATSIGNGILLLDGLGGSMFIQARAPKNKKLRQVRLTEGRSIFLSDSDQQQSTVWQVGRDGTHEHPTQKPIELARRAIENSSRPGEIVADGFLGSGTTLIGAEMTGRRCFGCELDPVYAEVIIRRWEKFTGKKATLERTTTTTPGKTAGADTRKPSGRSGPALRRAGPATRLKQKGAATLAAPLPNRASEAL
jgi:DNA modification methylase